MIVSVVDKREDKTRPSLPLVLDVESVVKSCVWYSDSMPLHLQIEYHTASLAAESMKLNSLLKSESPDMIRWLIVLLIREKDELTYGSLRALNRALAREIYMLSLVRSLGVDGLRDMGMSQVEKERTEFANIAPEALR